MIVRVVESFTMDQPENRRSSVNISAGHWAFKGVKLTTFGISRKDTTNPRRLGLVYTVIPHESSNGRSSRRAKPPTAHQQPARREERTYISQNCVIRFTPTNLHISKASFPNNTRPIARSTTIQRLIKQVKHKASLLPSSIPSPHLTNFSEGHAH